MSRLTHFNLIPDLGDLGFVGNDKEDAGTVKPGLDEQICFGGRDTSKSVRECVTQCCHRRSFAFY